jgi:hypothetical protein
LCAKMPGDRAKIRLTMIWAVLFSGWKTDGGRPENWEGRVRLAAGTIANGIGGDCR